MRLVRRTARPLLVSSVWGGSLSTWLSLQIYNRELKTTVSSSHRFWNFPSFPGAEEEAWNWWYLLWSCFPKTAFFIANKVWASTFARWEQLSYPYSLDSDFISQHSLLEDLIFTVGFHREEETGMWTLEPWLSPKLKPTWIFKQQGASNVVVLSSSGSEAIDLLRESKHVIQVNHIVISTARLEQNVWFQGGWHVDGKLRSRFVSAVVT